MSAASVAGQPARLGYTKWGGGRHWEADVLRLGEDDHGVWLGGRAGVEFVRPGVRTVMPVAFVCLVPVDRPWVATFYAEPGAGVRYNIRVYVDVTTVPVWSGRTLEVVDLDLDVVLTADGDLFIDDEDEFAQHQVELGYPPEVTEMARRSADEVLVMVAAGHEPFGTAYRPWLDLVR